MRNLRCSKIWLAVLLSGILYQAAAQPAQTLESPEAAGLLFEYHPLATSLTYAAAAPYDEPPFPEPYGMFDSWGALADHLFKRAKIVYEQIEGSFDRAAFHNVAELLSQPSGKPTNTELIYLHLSEPTRAGNRDILLTLNDAGYVDVQYPLMPPQWSFGDRLRVLPDGALFWMSWTFMTVHRLERFGDHFFVYDLGDDGVWHLAEYHRNGANPYVRVAPEEIPRDRFIDPA